MSGAPLRATLHIGWQGVTDGIVAELREQVKARKRVKAKRLASAKPPGGEREFWADLGRRAGVELVEVRGHTAVFEARGGRRPS